MVCWSEFFWKPSAFKKSYLLFSKLFDDLVNEIPSTVKAASVPASFCLEPFVDVLSIVDNPDPDGLSVAVTLKAFSFPFCDFKTSVKMMKLIDQTR